MRKGENNFDMWRKAKWHITYTSKHEPFLLHGSSHWLCCCCCCCDYNISASGNLKLWQKCFFSKTITSKTTVNKLHCGLHVIVFTMVQVNHNKKHTQLCIKKRSLWLRELMRNANWWVWMNLCLALTKCSTCNTTRANNSQREHISLHTFSCLALPSSFWGEIIRKLSAK